MPFKTIGNAILVETGKDHIQGDYTIATSPVFQKIMANAFGLPKEKVLITGQPCSDLLFANHGALQKLSINKECYKKVIMWMPTYRKSVVGAIRDDGNSDGFGVVSVFREHFDELNNKLKEHEYLLLIKPHPMDAINTIEFRESAHIKVVHNVDLEQKQVILYELLGEVDLLLTDYSSVFIDYLVLNKPIAFVFDDLDSYSETRGFSLKNPMEYLPGERITDFSQLLNYLENIDSINDGWRENRENITRLFHSYFDDKSSERVCKAIFDKNNLSV
jgi:CDP-glycerol glycerophosphotransferase (TagB/SpsB family)